LSFWEKNLGLDALDLRAGAMGEDLGYYERRLEQERAAAAASPSDHTRRAHEQMAELYSKMLTLLRSPANDRL
jgi:hypothetical protein